MTEKTRWSSRSDVGVSRSTSITGWAPIGSRHAATAARIRKFFTLRLDDRAVLWSQEPVLLKAPGSEPQPDGLILAPRADFYASALPEPQDVLLLIEVADSSLTYDRRTKLPLYARAGIAPSITIGIVDVAVDTKPGEITRRGR